MDHLRHQESEDAKPAQSLLTTDNQSALIQQLVDEYQMIQCLRPTDYDYNAAGRYRMMQLQYRMMQLQEKRTAFARETFNIWPRYGDSVPTKPIGNEELLANTNIYGIRKDIESETALLESKSDRCSSLTIDHLMRLNSATEFCKTSRDVSHDEPGELLKKKHRDSYHLGRILRELINYSSTLREVTNHISTILREVIDPDIKSFYPGVSKLMVAPFGNNGVRIHGPFSTSSRVQVAANFAHSNNGLIIQLGGGSDRALGTYLPVAWLSDYTSEKEYLFMQGEYPLQIHNIFHFENEYQYHWDCFESMIDALHIGNPDDDSNRVKDLQKQKYDEWLAPSSLLVNMVSIKQIIDTTPWDEVHVFNRVNPRNPDPSTLTMSKANFMDGLNYFVDRKDMNSTQLIPINTTSCVWIVHLFNAMDIGISLSVQNMKDIKVTAMYLDADAIRNQVKTPQQYECLDHFNSCVDDLVI
eukprot:609350_1